MAVSMVANAVEDHHGDAGPEGGDSPEHREPIQPGHAQVEEGEVDGVGLAHGEGFGAVRRRAHLVALAGQDLTEQIAGDRIVVGHQQPRAHRRSIAGQGHAHDGAAAFLALHLDVTVVLVDDLADDEEAQPRPPTGLLGREEGLEDLLAAGRRECRGPCR